jgi:hypothetical protein
MHAIEYRVIHERTKAVSSDGAHRTVRTIMRVFALFMSWKVEK